MLGGMQDNVRRHPFITLLIVLLLATLVMGVVGSFHSWSFNFLDKTFWLLIAAIVGLVTFLSDRWENAASRRIQTQLSFFDHWQELMTKIDQLEGKECSARAENIFRRYFELLHMEYLMRKHINPAVWKYWTKSREPEFADKTTYAGKTFSDWWERVKKEIDDTKFKDYIESCRNPADHA